MKAKVKSFVFLLALLTFDFYLLACYCLAQGDELDINLDVSSPTISLPKIFNPNIDLSGRGFSRDQRWPQGLAALQSIQAWEKDMGFSGLYRLQYNLWEINQLAKDKPAQDELLNNYDAVIKSISDAGGTVIVDLYGMPAGLGRVLDKKSPPVNSSAFKELVKEHMRRLSCENKFNVWYEVWSAPDLDDFFIGRQQEYLQLYGAAAGAVKELEAQYKIHIPLGGPAISWWFQNIEGNTVLSAEHSLIYELIRFCHRYRLSLDFITWHGFSTDPLIDKESTPYPKAPGALIRDWLSYFNFSKSTPLVIDEWNFDNGINNASQRQPRSMVSASYIPARLRSMYESGLDNQVFFSLENFDANKEGVIRNTGAFGFDKDSSDYKGNPKPAYAVFKMLGMLKKQVYSSSFKLKDDYVGMLATKADDSIAIMIYNYIDPDMAVNYLSRSIATLNTFGRGTLLGLFKAHRLEKILDGSQPVPTVILNTQTQVILKKAKGLFAKTQKFIRSPRIASLNLKNLKGDFIYQKYVLDTNGSLGDLAANEEKEINIDKDYQETLSLPPYSVILIVIKNKPVEPLALPKQPESAPAAQEKKETGTDAKKE